MMTKRGSFQLLGILGVLCCVMLRSVSAVTMGTGFTYQGRFMDGGSPADGTYDFEFELYDALTSGNQQGSIVTRGDVEVDDGYFTVELDFGGTVFDGDARWVQIGVRDGASTGAYTTLTPRHEMTPSPYSLYSGRTARIGSMAYGTTAGGYDYLSGTYNSFLYGSGIGCGVGFNAYAQLDGSPSWQKPSAYKSAWLNFGNADGKISFMRSASTTPGTITDGETSMMISADGNVGVGTMTPSHKLSVIDSLSGDTSLLRIGSGTTSGQTVGSGYSILFDTAATIGAGGGAKISALAESATGGQRKTGLAFFTDSQSGGGLRETVRITADGNVGIGTDSPFQIIHAKSSTPDLGMFESETNAAVIALFDSTTSWNCYHALVRMGDNLTLRTKNIDYFVIKSNGDVGIGGVWVPQEKLDVNGDVRCVDVVETSDAQLKTDVEPLSDVLDKLGQVRAVSFRWNEKAQAVGAQGGGREFGVLAQELEKVFPELVSTPKPVSIDEILQEYPEEMLTPEIRQQLQESAERSQYKAVSYSKLTVVLLEAVKELQAQNEALEARLEVLESESR